MSDDELQRTISGLMRAQQLALAGANAEIARLWRENEKLKKQIAKQPAREAPAREAPAHETPMFDGIH